MSALVQNHYAALMKSGLDLSGIHMLSRVGIVFEGRGGACSRRETESPTEQRARLSIKTQATWRLSHDGAVNMRPEHDVRRKVIREWMSLPRDKRQSREQAAAFAVKAAETNAIGRSSVDPHARVMAWLAPRTGKA